MSSEAFGGAQPRLLPPAIAQSMQAGVFRMIGFALCSVAVTAWIAVLSWTANDPGLSGTRSGKNLLGPFGAAGADFLIQTFGLVTILAISIPMIWGLEMYATRQPLPGIRPRAVAFPFGLLALAGALSALPTISAWPLYNGMGGMLGDLAINIVAMLTQKVMPDRALMTAGLLLGGLGIGLLAYCLVFGLAAHVRQIMGLPAKAAAPVAAPVAPPVAQPVAQPVATQVAEAAVAPVLSAAPPAAASVEPTLEIPTQLSFPLELDPTLGENGLDRGDEFDTETDEKARTVAARFAPGAKSDSRNSTAKAVEVETKPFAPVVEPRPAVTLPTGWQRPGIGLLDGPAADRPSVAARLTAADATAGRLVDALADYGVQGEIRDVKPGPVVTRYELEPARGTKTQRVISLADDIARSIGAHSVRIAVVPGRNAIGIEVPNVERETVRLSEIIGTETFQDSPAELPLALGKSIGGDVIVADLARMPHLLVAGTTGSGKSVGINAMILSLLYRHSPETCRLLLIDPKMLELAPYNGVPHLIGPVVTDPEAAAAALEWAVCEMESRYERMSKLGVRNIQAYNVKVRHAASTGRGLVRTVQTGFDPVTGRPVFEHERLDSDPLPYVVIVVDEFAELMQTASDRVEAALRRLSQMARAAGIHLVMATQRPSVDVVTGTLKSNIPMRLAFRVASRVDSRTILGESGAEMLLGHGDMLLTSGAGQPLRIHGAYVSEEEVARVTAALNAQVDPSTRASKRVVVSFAPDAQRYDEAVTAVLADRKVSVGHLVRRLGMDEGLAHRLIERMEAQGVVGPLQDDGRRKILAPAPATPSRKAVA